MSRPVHGREADRPALERLPAALRRARLVAALALALPAVDAIAIPLFWDPNLIAAGTGGTGTWNTSNARWAPVASGIALSGSVSNGVTWPNTSSAEAVFAGSEGTVTLSGTIVAQSVDFQTNGYVLTGGTLFLTNTDGTDGGNLFIRDGVTATVMSALDSPVVQGGRRIGVIGTGTLVMASPTRYTGLLMVRSGTLRPKDVDSLGGTYVFLEGSAPKLDLAGLSTVNVGGLFTASSLPLGNSQLVITGSGDFGGTSNILGTVSGSGTSGLFVGTQGRVELRIGASGFDRTTIGTGFLHYNAGDSFIQNADVTLTQTGSTGFNGRSSLFLEVGTSLTVDGASVLSLSGTPQLHNDAVLNVGGASRVSVARSAAAPSTPASLRVGFAGGTSKLVVTDDNTVVEAQDMLHIGNDAFTPNPGVGAVSVGGGATVRAPILSFGSAGSSILVSTGGVAEFSRFASSAGLDRAGTVRIEGGEFRIGDGLQSNLDTGDSTFKGKLTGASGQFIKSGTGTTALTSGDSDFLGTVSILDGQLTVAPGALKNAVLTMAPGTVLAAPGATLDTPLMIGALSGQYDLPFDGIGVRLGGGDHTAAWQGRFTAGNVFVSRVSSGIQTFAGGTTDAPFSAQSVSTSGGTFRLDGGVFRLTATSHAVTDRTSLFAQHDGARIEIVGGAQVSAGTGVRIHNAGRIVVSGDGTRLDITPVSINGPRAAFIGSFGGGTLEVTDGAAMTASHVLLGNAGEKDAVSTLVVSRNGRVNISSFLQIEGEKAGLTVDQGTVAVGQFFVRSPEAFTGIIRLSDPVLAAGANRLTAPAALTISSSNGLTTTHTLTILDAPSGPGSLAFVGTGFTETLGGTLSYTGRTIVDGNGTLVRITAPLASRDVIARNGGRFEFQNPGTWDTTRTTFRTETGGQVSFSGTNVVGGTLRGSSFEASNTTFDGTSLAINSRMTTGPGVNWSNAVMQGTLETFHATGLDNVTVSTSGSVIVHLAASFSDVENNGLLDIRDGAGVNVIGGLASGGGSRILVGSGATVTGDTITLNGALLKNNGTVTAPLVINYLGTAKGAGTFGSVSVNDGGTFSPGNSPGIAQTGSVTFNEGGAYEVEIADALGDPGMGFDLWDVAGNLAFNAGTTANSRFVISLVTLDGSNAPGPAANFDKRHSFAWTVLRADSVSGFDANELRLDTAGFANGHDGQFSLALKSVDGRSELQIVYQPVPEPATNALLLGGLAALFAWRQRRGR